MGSMGVTLPSKANRVCRRSVDGGRRFSGIIARMTERARTFAERVPPLAPPEEEDTSHLSDAMADVLYPGSRPRAVRMGVVFRPFEGPNWPRALEIAKRSPVYREESEGPFVRHHAGFDAGAARSLLELLEIVAKHPGTEVLLDGRHAPYAHELWLPLFWLFIGREE